MFGLRGSLAPPKWQPGVFSKMYKNGKKMSKYSLYFSKYINNIYGFRTSIKNKNVMFSNT